MASPSHARCPTRAGRGCHQIPAHFSSLAALLQVVREYGDGASPIRCAARHLELPAPQSLGMPRGVWGVLVTARIRCAAGHGEATLSVWIVAEELPRHVATTPRRAGAPCRPLQRRAGAHPGQRVHLPGQSVPGAGYRVPLPGALLPNTPTRSSVHPSSPRTRRPHTTARLSRTLFEQLGMRMCMRMPRPQRSPSRDPQPCIGCGPRLFGKDKLHR